MGELYSYWEWSHHILVCPLAENPGMKAIVAVLFSSEHGWYRCWNNGLLLYHHRHFESKGHCGTPIVDKVEEPSAK